MRNFPTFKGKLINNDSWVEGQYVTTPLTDENSGTQPEAGWFFLTGETRHCIVVNGVTFTCEPSSIQVVHTPVSNIEKYLEGKERYWINEGGLHDLCIPKSDAIAALEALAFEKDDKIEDAMIMEEAAKSANEQAWNEVNRLQTEVKRLEYLYDEAGKDRARLNFEKRKLQSEVEKLDNSQKTSKKIIKNFTFTQLALLLISLAMILKGEYDTPFLLWVAYGVYRGLRYTFKDGNTNIDVTI